MKPIVKYISLLLFSGLILPFYNASNKKPPAAKATTIINTPIPLKTQGTHYFIYEAIAEWYFPELTN